MKLGHRGLAVMSGASGEPISEIDLAAPYIVCGGAAEAVAGLEPAAEDEAVWVLGWRDGLTVGVCLKAGRAPDPEKVREIAEELGAVPRASLEYMEPANEHPC